MLVCAETSALMLWQGEAENESTLTLDPPTVLVLVSEHFELTRVDTSNTTSILKQKGISRRAGRDSLPSHFGHCSGGLSFYGSASNWPSKQFWDLVVFVSFIFCDWWLQCQCVICVFTKLCGKGVSTRHCKKCSQGLKPSSLVSNARDGCPSHFWHQCAHKRSPRQFLSSLLHYQSHRSTALAKAIQKPLWILTLVWLIFLVQTLGTPSTFLHNISWFSSFWIRRHRELS